MANPGYVHGSWNVICDVCGREYKAGQLRGRWDGLMVCQGDWEPRQPQDFVRGVADKMAPAYTRPEAADADSFVFYCTRVSSQGVADIGQADCAQANINAGLVPTCTFEGSRGISGYSIAGCAIAGRTSP